MMTKSQIKYKARMNIAQQQSIDEKIEVFNMRINQYNEKKIKLKASLFSLQKECKATFGHNYNPKNNVCDICGHLFQI